ncbi:porin family protein [Robertkochia solimangrovi]|uniref:porin family protein n=1 Tax=Robertkochia solimangrovi TaxID=2213046 RepID=UPI0011804C7C|nr:porin family protein [Robertkochia solimangrovi]TRZ45160.1 hypothetical protein DMZ48_05260 [Robertkochia solimangrovi]
MKKPILTCLLLFGIICFAHAQRPIFAAKGGVNFADMAGPNGDLSDMRTSFHAGLLASFMLSEKFSFQPELLYSSQGYSEVFLIEEPIATDFNADIKLSYLTLPVMFKFYILDGLSIDAGPQLGYKLDENVKYDAANISDSFDSDEYNDLTVGANIGFTVYPGEKFFLTARYNRDLLSNVDSNYDEQYNSVIQLSAGFYF